MVTIKDGCGCDPCDCDWKQKLKEAYARASVSVNKIGDFDGGVYFPDGSGFVKLPIPKLADVQQISTNTQDIAELKVTDAQLQTNITAEENARIASITAEKNARIESITAEETARKSKDENLDSDIARIDATDARQTELIRDNADRINSTYNDLVATEATVATHNSEIITLQANNQALAKSLVSDVIMTDGTTAGSVQVSIEREDGALITSANYRWGKDIGIRLEAGTQAGYVKAVISLSDGTELVSNEYKIVEVLESDVYVTAITLIADQTAGTLGGNISYSNGTTQTINSVSVPTAPGVTSAIEALQGRMTAVEQKNANQDASITAIDGRVQALENTPGIGQFANGRLGTIAGSTTDGRVKAENDGTGSVNGWSDLKSRISVAEGQIVAAQGDISDLDGRIGTHDTEISGIMSDITAIKTKNTQQDTAINGKISIAQGSANAGKALVVGPDGNVTPVEISSGEVWEAVDLSETGFPTDWKKGDRIKVSFKYFKAKAKLAPTSWTSSFSTTGLYIDSVNGEGTDILEFEINDTSAYNYTHNSLISISTYVDTNNSPNAISLFYCKTGSYTEFNNRDRRDPLFIIYIISFNGSSCQYASTAVYNNALTSYINKMWRLKR